MNLPYPQAVGNARPHLLNIRKARWAMSSSAFLPGYHLRCPHTVVLPDVARAAAGAAAALVVTGNVTAQEPARSLASH